MARARVYIGKLPRGVRERDIENFFQGYGHIHQILIKSGYGFVVFDDDRDAEDAVYDLDDKRLLGQRIIVQKARGVPRGRDRDSYDSNSTSNYRGTGSERYGAPTRTNYRVIVENLSSSVSWQNLKDFMRKAGEVTYADAHNAIKNVGVVEFTSYSEMKNAIKRLDNSELDGRRITVTEDKESRGRRSYTRSRTRSYSRSVSKSRSRTRSPRNSRSVSPRKSHSSRRKNHSRSVSPRNHSSSRSPNKHSKSASPRSNSKSRSPSITQNASASPSKGRKRSRELSNDRIAKQMRRSRSRSIDNQ